MTFPILSALWAVPVLGAIADRMLLAGENLSLIVVANDPDGVDTLTYSLLGGPAGALLDSATGALSWSAPYLDAATVVTFTVGVDDGLGGSDQLSFDVTVDPDLLQVDSVTWTDTGYQLRFNRAFDTSLLNLYTLSLHDALPISELQSDRKSVV